MNCAEKLLEPTIFFNLYFNKKIWITRGIVRQIRKKKQLYINYRLTREPQTYNRYKEIEAHVKQLIKDSVQRFEQKLGDNIKHDSKSFYKYVKSKQQVKDSITGFSHGL